MNPQTLDCESSPLTTRPVLQTWFFSLGGYNRGSQKQCYTLTNAGWTQNYSLSVARHFASSIKMPDSDEIFFLGGENNSSGSLSTAEILNQNGFELIQMEKKFSRHCATPVDSTRILIIGGINEDEYYSPKTFIYNTSLNAFMDGPTLMRGRHFHSCSRMNERHFLVAGGQDLWGGLSSVEILDNANGEWYEGPRLPRKISYASMVIHPSGGVVIVGGQSGQTLLQNLYYLAQVNTEWVVMTQQLKTPRRFHIAVMVQNSITFCSTGNS